MAYKFQRGAAILSGAVTQEGNILVHNESGTEVGSFKQSGALSGSGAAKVLSLDINSSTAAISSAGAYSGVSVDVSGKVDGATGFDVNGTNVVDSSRNIVNAGTLSGSGKGSFASIALDSVDVTSTGAELNLVDGSSAGTVVNSKAVIYGGAGQVIATSVSASNAVEGASLSVNHAVAAGSVKVDDGSTIGTDSDTDMLTLTNGDNITVASDLELRVGNLTNGRVATVGANSKLTDHSNFTFGSDVLAVPGISASANISASAFYGDGANITGITADTIDVTSSAANTLYELVFVQDLGSDKSLGGSLGASFNPAESTNGAIMKLSGAVSGRQASIIAFGGADDYVGREVDGSDDLFVIKSGKAIDISGSGTGGVLIFAGHDTSEAGVVVQGAAGFKVADESENTLVSIDGSNGHVSSSGDGRFLALDINGTEAITSARAGALTSLAVSDLTDNRVLIAGTSGEVEDSANLTFDGSTLSVTGVVSGSGNFQIGGSLKAQGLGSATVDLTADLMIIDDGAGGDIKTTSLANYATALAAGGNEGLSSTAGRLAVDLNDLTAASVSVANDSIAIIDADDSNGTRKESIADLVSAVAGAGLTATNGVLSTQAGALTTDVRASVTLSEGYNVYTGSSDISVSLPTGSGLSAGDVFTVKQNSAGKITINRAGTDTIDGESSIVLESAYAAVSILFTGVGGDFRIV